MPQGPPNFDLAPAYRLLGTREPKTVIDGKLIAVLAKGLATLDPLQNVLNQAEGSDTPTPASLFRFGFRPFPEQVEFSGMVFKQMDFVNLLSQLKIREDAMSGVLNFSQALQDKLASSPGFSSRLQQRGLPMPTTHFVDDASKACLFTFRNCFFQHTGRTFPLLKDAGLPYERIMEHIRVVTNAAKASSPTSPVETRNE